MLYCTALYRHPTVLTHCPLRDWMKLYTIIFQIILVIGRSCEITFGWMSPDLTDGKLKLVLLMAWCHQPTIHYLSQCLPRSMLPYGITRLQWVKKHKITLAFFFSTFSLLRWYMQLKSFLAGHMSCLFCIFYTLLLMTWLCREPGHQQPWYWHKHPRICTEALTTLLTFADIVKCIFFNENSISLFDLNFTENCSSLDLTDKSALVQGMTWFQMGSFNQWWHS